MGDDEDAVVCVWEDRPWTVMETKLAVLAVIHLIMAYYFCNPGTLLCGEVCCSPYRNKDQTDSRTTFCQFATPTTGSHSTLSVARRAWSARRSRPSRFFHTANSLRKWRRKNRPSFLARVRTRTRTLAWPWSTGSTRAWVSWLSMPPCASSVGACSAATKGGPRKRTRRSRRRLRSKKQERSASALLPTHKVWTVASTSR